MTRPCRGATLIGNCLDALAAIDAVGNDFAMKTGICGKGGQQVPVGTGQGHVRVARDDRRRDRGVMSELSAAAQARRRGGARRPGAGEAEAYASRDSGREVRVHGGEVESLTAATQRGIGVRAWIGDRVGYAFGTDLCEAGVAAIAARAVEAAAVADEDEFAAPPGPAERRGARRAQRPLGRAPGRRREVAELALAVEREALAADPRVAGVEQAVYADSAEQVAIASSTGIAGEYEASSCLRLHAGPRRGRGRPRDRPRLRPRPRARRPRPGRRSGARAPSGRLAMIGAGKPESRACPVVLDPTVAASFAGLIGGALGADAVQRGRSPFAEPARRGGRPARRSPSTTTASTPRAPPRRRSTARACRAAAPR